MQVISNGNIFYNEDTSNIYGSKIIKKLLKKRVNNNSDEDSKQSKEINQPKMQPTVEKKGMSKGMKIGLIAVGSLLLAVTIYLIIRKKK